MKKHLLHLNYFLLAAACVALCALSLATPGYSQTTLVKDFHSGGDAYATDFEGMQLHTDGNIYLMFRHSLYKTDGTKAGTVRLGSFEFTRELTSSGPYVYFMGLHYDSEGQTLGQELWRSDGTPEGTIMVKDIRPGESGSDIRDLTDVNGTLFFVANNGVNGFELWKSDGTPEGTVIVKDILRVSGSANPRDLVALNGKVYFSANDAQKGYELWMSDGTAEGTVLAADVNTGLKASSHPGELVNAGGTLFFFANDGLNGRQLWKSNGEQGNATLVKTIRPGGNNSLAKMTVVGSSVFFQANDGVHGIELWKSDGTAEGTFMVKDITPGPGSMTAYATDHIQYLSEAGGRLYFQAISVDYLDLWTSDGTEEGTYPITEKNSPGFAWTGHGAVYYNGLTYFAGMSAEENSYFELWRTDGTFEGTERLHENIGVDAYYNNLMGTILNGKLYFIGNSQLWQTDGSYEGTIAVKSFGDQYGGMPRHLTDHSGELFFASSGEGLSTNLWKTNGTAAGTQRLTDIIWNIDEIASVDASLYFAARTYRHGDELWTSDGTREGTHLVKDITDNPDATFSNSSPRGFIGFNGKTYFSAYSPYHNPHLWSTNGEAEGTQPVFTGETGPGFPSQFTRAGGKLFFTAQGDKGVELYVYDGNNLPTLTRDLKLHYMGSYPQLLTEFNGILYFIADNRSNGYELHRSDGTLSGTYVIKDIRKYDLADESTGTPAVVDFGNMMPTSEALYFSAIRLTGQNALWRSDGTSNGTKPFFTFEGLPTIEILSAEETTFIFTATYDTGVQLWKSNGTASGTKKISDLPLRDIKRPAEVAVKDGVTYFIGHTGSAHYTWRTDGTPEGTYAIDFDGVPYELEVSGGKLYMSGHSGEYGWELFIINDEPTSIAARSATAGDIPAEESRAVEFSTYPNPFTEAFLLNVPGETATSFKLNVRDANGTIVEVDELDCNVDHSIGRGWREGLYLIQIATDTERITKKIIKRN